MARVLLTGFEPFAGATVNPSWDAVQEVARSPIPGVELIVRRLPVVFGDAAARLLEHITLHTPDLVIAVGVAEGRSRISVETVAHNLDDARIPDNLGRQPLAAPTVPGGPETLASTLPVELIVAALEAQGIPAEASDSAGSFVCNHAFYALQHALREPRVPSGFIHVPATMEMELGHAIPTLPLDTIARALRIAIETSLAAPAATVEPESRHPEDA